MALASMFRQRWLERRGFYSPDAPSVIPNTPKAREENRQQQNKRRRKNYRMGMKVPFRRKV